MLTIMHLAWPEACDSRWSSFAIIPALTEQRRNRLADTCRMVLVTLTLASRPSDPISILVKLQSPPEWELNFRATPKALMGLRSIRDADWTKRRCLHIGESAGAPVHWAAEGETATILVGHDQETWDIAVTVPIATVETIVTATAARSW
jgi:hypothetical protein